MDTTQKPALSAALVEAQRSITGIEKDSQNTFHKYKYVSGEAMIHYCSRMLTAAGLTVVPTSTALRSVEGYNVNDGKTEWPLLIMVREYRISHGESGESLTMGQEWPVVPERGRPLDKATAAADTASLGYFLRTLLLVPRVDQGTELDDPSRDESGPPLKPQQPARKIDPTWKDDRREFVAAVGDLSPHLTMDALDAWCDSIRRPRPSAMTSAQRGKLMDYLEANIAAVEQWAIDHGHIVLSDTPAADAAK